MTRCLFLQLVVAAMMLCAPAIVHAEQDDAFAKGNEAYAAGDFRSAIDRYESVLGVGETSAAVFYNLANAYYRAGDFGRAILNYERALALEPFHPEAQTNLRLARDKARALELRQTLAERAASWFTLSTYSIAAAVSFWIAAFALAGRLLAQKRLAAASAIFALALITFAACVAALYTHESGKSGRALAIVTANKIDARLATADNAGTVLALPPGSEIKILSTRGDWVYAQLPNELRGWIPAQAAERVRL